MKKNRSTLKEYFKKGAIPTESNFGDLIDSMLNQDEDNIGKLPNDPLKIVATGADEALLNFYRLEQNEEKLSWQVKQKPGGSPGLSIGDETASRLFIESGSGKVGIGTTAPTRGLDVKSSQGIKLGLEGNGGGQLILANNKNDNKVYLEAFSTDGANSADEFLLTGRNSGPVPKLSFRADTTSISGNFEVAGNQQIIFSDKNTSNNLKLQLWSGYGLGINNSTLFYAANGQHSWRDSGGTNERMLLTTGADGGLTVKGTGNSSFAGNVGVGTASIHNPQGWVRTLDIFADNSTRLNVRSSNVVTSVFSHDNWNGPRGVIGTESNHPLTFATNYTHQMTLQTNGNLDVNGTIRALGGIRIDGNLGDHLPGDGSFYRYNGQVYITVDDNFYIRDTDGNIRFYFNTNNGQLNVTGAVMANNSDMYFTKTDHDHSGFGNTDGYAAIENSRNFDALMILGRAHTGGIRTVKLWDYLEVIGQFVNHSDRRSKQDIEDLECGLDEIKNLRPVSFNWIGKPNQHKNLGLIAQEVQSVIKDLVYEDSTDSGLSIAYLGLIPVLINAVKELDKKIEQLAS